MNFWSVLYGIIGLACLAYGVLLLYFYRRQETMIFFPSAIETSPDILQRHQKDEVSFHHQGVDLHGWFLQSVYHDPQKTPTLIYYGGNREEISHHLLNIDKMTEYSVLFMNYRGYGKSTGNPGQKQFCQDAVFIFDRLVEQGLISPQQVILVGRSLGSGVATAVASQRAVAGVILVTPFDSLARLAKHRYPFLPVTSILKHPFHSISVAPTISAPLLGILAGKDRVVPNQFSLNLFQQWAGPCRHFILEEAEHHNIHEEPIYWEHMTQFIESCLLKRA